MSFFHKNEIRDEELAALADGSLPPERRALVEERVASSPDLRAALEEQRRALELVRGVAVGAPPALRERIEARRGARHAVRRRRGLVLGAGLAAAAAIVVLLLVTLPGGVSGPSVAEAATLATRPSTAPPPPPLPQEPKLLDASVDGVAFPSWDEKFGWRAAGARTDTLGGRETETVFYEKDGKQIAYTIVGGDSLPVPDGARATEAEGTELHVVESGDRTVVTWERNGRTCVLSGEDVPTETLVKLAAWKGKGAVGF